MVSSHVRAGLAAARPSPPFSPSPWSPSKKPPAPCCSHPLRSRRSPPRRRIRTSHSSWWSCAPSCRGLRGPSWGPHVVLVAVGSERQESRETRPRTARENPSLIFHLPNKSFANHFVTRLLKLKNFARVRLFSRPQQRARAPLFNSATRKQWRPASPAAHHAACRALARVGAWHGLSRTDSCLRRCRAGGGGAGSRGKE